MRNLTKKEKNNERNERKGRMSASGFEYYAACPGRFQMEQGQPDTSSEAATRGTLIHDWLESRLNGGALPALPPEDLTMAESCLRDLETVLGWVWPDWRQDPPQFATEKRLWYRRNRYSGKADVVADYDRHFLVLDYKTGPVPVPEAKDNWQLKALGALLVWNFKPRAITHAIVQPACGGPTIATVDGAKALSAMRQQVLNVVRASEKIGARLQPGGSQCKYCRAKAVCPALLGESTALTTLSPVATLTTTEMADVMEKLGRVKSLVKAVEERAKSMLEEDEGCIPGWGLKDGSKRRTVTDNAAAVNALRQVGLIGEEGDFTKIELGKLEKAVAQEHGIPLPAARNMVAEAIGNFITVKEGSRQLCRAD